MRQQHISRRKAMGVVAAMAASTLMLGACSFQDARPSADGLDIVKVATVGLTSDGALITGMDKGFFAEEGIEVRTSLVKDPPAGLAAAQSGQVDVAYSPSISILMALSRKMPIGVIAGADGFSPAETVAAQPEEFDDTALLSAPGSGIESVEQLEGKTISVPARKAQLEVNIAAGLADAGVSPDSINWVVLDFTSAVAALRQGQIDAAGVVSPFTAMAEADGATHLLAPSYAFFGPSAVGMWTVGDKTYAEDPELMQRFKRAMERSNAYANDHPEEVTQAGLEFTKSGLALDQVARPYWPEEVSEEDLEPVNGKLVDLEILSTPVDLRDVVKMGAAQ
ncbi:ABC transporter substrate-binding protein [Brevibacterium luteolum]|uniref:ABC transporter substrate-binding protein n=1 Tax=Brevibacterium luteolum TaxID=199591 RepID=UPI001C21442C|nr:ABC transporter substrate-binding protein [Brevibacterium luteolum]MBU8578713.1 ABC transporter substrate-binding protein [Brevibacterium luteolum]